MSSPESLWLGNFDGSVLHAVRAKFAEIAAQNGRRAVQALCGRYVYIKPTSARSNFRLAHGVPKCQHCVRITEGAPGAKPIYLTVNDARKLKVCRICYQSDAPGQTTPLVVDYGREYAHQACLQRLQNLVQQL